MARATLFTILPLALLNTVQAQTACEPVANDFETPPLVSPTTTSFLTGLAFFTDGQVQPTGLATSGSAAWLVEAGMTGSIEFLQPAVSVELFLRDEDAGVQSIATAFDANGNVVGTASGSHTTSTQLLVPAGGSTIARVDIQNTGAIGVVAVDDFSACVEIPSNEFCHGDGGDQMGCADCPCSNNAPAGSLGGCLTSSGTVPRLLRSGSSSVANADLRFEALGFPTGILNVVVLVSGENRLPTNPANPCFGLDSGVNSVSFEGLRCVGGNVLRHGLRPGTPDGHVGLLTHGWGAPSNFFNFSAFVPGGTRHFQGIYREAQSTLCLAGAGTTQGISVTFIP